MTILLTGGLGHIGSKLIPELLDLDNLIVIDSLATQRFGSIFNLKNKNKLKLITQECQSVESKQILAISRPSSVVHLAAHNEAEKFQQDPERLRLNNISATKWADAFASEMGIPLIFPSSTSVYNRNGIDLTESETGEAPLSNYAQVKKEEEEFLENANTTGSKNFVLRLGTIYGTSPGMRFHTAINSFCWNHANGLNLKIWGNALQLTRPYLALEDAVLGIKKIIGSQNDLPSLINLVTENLTLLEVIKLLEDISGREVKMDVVESPVMSNLSFSVSNKLALNHNFSFFGEIRNGIGKTLEMLGGLKA